MRMNGTANASDQRLRFAELTSAIGAGVLGLGLGVLLPNRIHEFGILIAVVGALVHAWGMTDKHMLESEISRRSLWWSTALYWICWLLLAALAGWVVFRLATL